MAAWAIHETRMRVERRRSQTGREGWTVTWKGRGWDRSFDDYLALVRRPATSPEPGEIVAVPSVKYHLPRLDEPFRSAEYRHTTERMAAAGATDTLSLEKDFSPTLAGDALADERNQILRWLREVPDQIRRARPARPPRAEADERPFRRRLSAGNAARLQLGRRAGGLQPAVGPGAAAWRMAATI